MVRLPTVGGDSENWGTILNEFLKQEHDADGTHGTITPTDIKAQGPWVDVRVYASINAAVTAIGSTKTTLLVPKVQTLTANLTIPSTLTLKILKGGSIVKASTYTLTINGPFEAGLYQVFSGFSPRDVTFGSVKEVYPQWWGATGDGVTDDSTTIQDAITSIPAGYSPGGIIYTPPGIYLCTARLLNSDRRISFTGSGIDQTIIKKNANNIDLLKLDICYQSIWQKIKDMTFDGNSKTGGSLLYLSQTNYIKLENLYLTGSESDVSALYLHEATGTILQDVYIFGNKKTAFFNAVHGCRIYNLKVGPRDGIAAADDVDFFNAAQTALWGFNQSTGAGGLTIRDCGNFAIYSMYQETPLQVPAITIGTSENPNSWGVSINDVNGTVCGTPAVGPFIKAQYCQGLTIRNVELAGSQPVAYTGGWIKLGAGVFGVTIENITAWNMSANYTSAVNLIFSDAGDGPTNVSINNVNAYNVGGTATIDLKITNGKISNCNCYINLKNYSYNVVLMNCSGPITIQSTCSRITLINCSGEIRDGSGTAYRINSPG